ncbi:hypothetical protein [Paraburkholderia sp. BR14374]|uniref:hypothetical protein n=1 Tax=Paraburkholderia sp. BR14374 TaxID=3237007 RepID=UPI0034CE96FB
MHTLRLIGRAIVTCVSIDGGMIAVLLAVWIALKAALSPLRLAAWLKRKRA